MAELWFGTHPSGPSTLESGERLDAVVANNPIANLGADSYARFGARLPYLVKFLAAAAPLSIQVHPTSQQAREGFARENAAGVALDSPLRVYRDDQAKPEILIALSRFEALCGLRPLTATIEFLLALDVAGLQPVVERLRRGHCEKAVADILTMAPDDQHHLVAALRHGAQLLNTRHWAAEAECLIRLAEHYPDDTGVVIAALLNRVVLNPGEAVFLPAGNIHAYVNGLGLEVLAASDNVVRGGMTTKHVDVAELLNIADFTELAHPVVHASEVEPGCWSYPSAAKEFSVLRCDTPQGTTTSVHISGPKILVCTQGNAGRIRQGEALWIPDSTGLIDIHGPSTVFAIAVPPA